MENINKTIHTYTTENVVLYDPLMISANTNTVLRALDFNQENKLVAYSAANTILIMDPYYTSDQSQKYINMVVTICLIGYLYQSDSQDQQKQVPRVLFSLKGHSDRVNSVQWINSNTLVSISSDKVNIICYIWGFEGENGRLPENWTFKKIYQNAHDTDINYLRTYKHEQNNELYVHSMCRDGTLKVWQGTSRDIIKKITYFAIRVFPEINLTKINLQEALGVVEFGEKHLMVVLGGYDAKIHVYLFPTIQHQNSEAKSLFKYKVSLPGHMDALRDYDFTPFYVEIFQFLFEN